MARSSSFRRFARSQDIYVRGAIDSADLLPLTAPSLSFEDLRALVITKTTEVFSPSTIQAKFGISPNTVERQQDRSTMMDARWKEVFHAVYETKIALALGMSTEPEKPWIHHLIETVNHGAQTTEQILSALPLQYFPWEQRMKNVSNK